MSKTPNYAIATSNGIQQPSRIVSGTGRAGYAPDALDSSIRAGIDTLERLAQQESRWTPMLEDLMHEIQGQLGVLMQMSSNTSKNPQPHQTLPDLLRLANQVSIILDRINKNRLNSTKAADELSRLKVFLGGDTERTAYEDLGETQLRRLLEEGVKKFGGAVTWTS